MVKGTDLTVFTSLITVKSSYTLADMDIFFHNYELELTKVVKTCLN